MVDGREPGDLGLDPADPFLKSDFDRAAEKPSEILWQSDDTQVILPDVQATPEEEGMHIEVVPKGETTGDWRTDSVKNVVNESYYSLAAARALALSGRTPDYWANVHWNSRPEFVAGANVYGKNPTSETAWVKPVDMQSGGVEEPGNAAMREEGALGRFSGRYFHMWESTKSSMTIFQDGIHEVAKGSNEFAADAKAYKEKGSPYQETLLWENDKFALVAVDVPHLTGFHLVVHPRPEYWGQKNKFSKPWQQEGSYVEDDPEHERGFLESVAVLKLVQGLLSQDKDLNFNNPEIHYSGNWAGDLRTSDQGGKVDLDKVIELNGIGETRQYKKELNTTVTAGMHGHLYATKSAGEYVNLPTRPASEVPEQWAHIQPMSEAEVEKIRTLVDQGLSSHLEELVEYNLGGIKE